MLERIAALVGKYHLALFIDHIRNTVRHIRAGRMPGIVSTNGLSIGVLQDGKLVATGLR